MVFISFDMNYNIYDREYLTEINKYLNIYVYILTLNNK